MIKPSKLLFETEISGFGVKLFQQVDRTFSTRYGQEWHHHLSYSEAATQLGLAIMHGLTCEGKIKCSEKS